MPKIMYLVKDEKGYKLRRSVPAKARNIIGRSTWIERLSGLSNAEIKHRAALFTIATNKQLNNALERLSPKGASKPYIRTSEPGFITRPSQRNVEQIALSYFHERDTDIMLNGGYVPPSDLTDMEQQSVEEDAGLDLADAQRKLKGSHEGNANRTTTMKLLVDHGFESFSGMNDCFLLMSDERQEFRT